METDKLLLEIYGKVEATSVNVTHILNNHKCLDDKVMALHKRVDKHDGYIKYGMGVMMVIGAIITMAWEWIKAKWRA